MNKKVVHCTVLKKQYSAQLSQPEPLAFFWMMELECKADPLAQACHGSPSDRGVHSHICPLLSSRVLYCGGLHTTNFRKNCQCPDTGRAARVSNWRWPGDYSRKDTRCRQ